jgi:hypothetical protein
LESERPWLGSPNGLAPDESLKATGIMAGLPAGRSLHQAGSQRAIQGLWSLLEFTLLRAQQSKDSYLKPFSGKLLQRLKDFPLGRTRKYHFSELPQEGPSFYK